MNWLYTWLGLSNASGAQYLFWSGIFGDATIFAAIIGLYFHKMCHVPGCPWPGHADHHGVVYCKKHNPHKKKGEKL